MKFQKIKAKITVNVSEVDEFLSVSKKRGWYHKNGPYLKYFYNFGTAKNIYMKFQVVKARISLNCFE